MWGRLTRRQVGALLLVVILVGAGVGIPGVFDDGGSSDPEPGGETPTSETDRPQSSGDSERTEAPTEDSSPEDTEAEPATPSPDPESTPSPDPESTPSDTVADSDDESGSESGGEDEAVNVGSGDTSGGGDGSDSSAGDGSQTPDQVTPSPNVQLATASRIDNNTVEIAVPAGEEERTIRSEASPAAEEANVTLERLDVSTVNSEPVEITVSRSDSPLEGGGSLRLDGGLAYFNVSHPTLADEDIAGATFRISINRELVGSDREPVLYRFVDGQWVPLDATLVERTETRDVYRVKSPGLSLFGLLPEQPSDRTPRRSGVMSVELVDRQDIDDDNVYSAFDVRVRGDQLFSDSGEVFASEPYLNVYVNGRLVAQRNVDGAENDRADITLEWDDIGRLERQDLTVTVELRDREFANQDPDRALVAREDTTVGYEPVYAETGADDATTTLLLQSGTLYGQYHDRSLNSDYWDTRAEQNADVAASQFKQLLLSFLQIVSDTADLVDVAASRGALAAGDLVTRGLVSTVQRYLDVARATVRGGTVAFNVAGALDAESVAIHLDDRYTEDQYDEIRGTLSDLEENTAALKTAVREGDEERQAELLRERKALLEELNREIPQYTDALHESVIRNSRGQEDLRAYSILRRQLETLRVYTYLQYELTTAALSESGRSESLRSSSPMPTHGWQGSTLTGLNGKSVVYDTFETEDDYAVYRVNPDEYAGSDVSFKLEKGNSGSFEAQVFDSRPPNLQTADGTPFDASGNGNQYTISNAKGDYYIIVRADGETGFYKLIARANPGGISSDPVGVTVVTRKGPDTQRPDVRLVESPPAEELQSGAIVYPTREQSVSLTWSAWDDKTNGSDIEYRYRVDNGSGFSSWSAWRTATDDRQIPLEFEFRDGVHRVQLVVRDEAGKQTVRNVDVPVSRFTPTTTIVTDDNPRANNVFVRILPERRVDEVELQYRAQGEEEWQSWKTVDDTDGFGRLNFPNRGAYELRARAVGLANNTGEWDTTTLEYDPPDRTAPSISLADAPNPVRVDYDEVSNRYERKRITSRETVPLAWDVSDRRAPNASLEYRYRIDTPRSDSSWSPWTTVSETGRIRESIDLPEGRTRVEVAVRDPADNVRRTQVDVTADRTAPTVGINASGGVQAATLQLNASERTRRVDVQYRSTNETAWSEWSLTGYPAVSTRENKKVVSVPESGTFEVRVRAVDFASNVGPWRTDTFTSDARERIPREKYPRNQSIPPTSPGDPGPPIEINDSEEIVDDVITGAVKGKELIEMGWRNFDGEVVIGLYRITRSGQSQQFAEIEYSPERNQTIRADLPDNLTAGDRLGVSVRNRGGESDEQKVVLESLRLYGAAPGEPSVTVTPDRPTEGSAAELSATTPNAETGSIQRYEWDFDLDGTYERRGKRINQTFLRSGPNAFSIRVTDVFGAATATTTVVDVNARPQFVLGGVNTTRTGEPVTIDASQSRDPDGTIERYRWDIDGDETFERDGQATTRTYPDDGRYRVGVRLIDNDSAVATTNRTIRVLNRPPSMEWNYAPPSPTTNESITFDATASTDADGTVETVEWDFDRDGEYERTGTTVSARFESPGSRTVGVRAVDDDDASVNATRTFYVNAPPKPNIEAPTSILTFEGATLNGSDSIDPDGAVETYEWDIDGDGQFERTGRNSSRTFQDDGNYSIGLRVTDERGATATTNTTVKVTNRDPRANASYEPGIPMIGESTTFDAGRSADRDGSIDEVAWDFNDDGTFERTGEVVERSFAKGGDYQIRVRVTDDDGATDTTTVRIHVNIPPKPVVTAGDPVQTGEGVELDAAQSTDPDGNLTNYEWDLDDDGQYERSERNVTRSYADDGNYTVGLRVTDDEGATASTKTNVTVQNRPPDVTATLTTEQPVVGGETGIAATANDSDGEVVNFEWRFASNGSFESEGPTATHTYRGAGTRTATVRAVDDDGATTTANVMFYVNTPPDPAVETRTPIPTGTETTLNGSESVDPDGEIASYEWDIDGDGTFERTGRTTASGYEDDGNYTVRLRITDDRGTTATANTTLRVTNRPPRTNVTYAPDVPRVNDTATFDASASTDRDGTVEAVSWDLDDDGVFEQRGASVEYAFAESGDHRVRIRVTDDDGATNTTARQIHVNVPPTPVIDTNGPIRTDESIRLDGGGSTDPDGQISRYLWFVETPTGRTGIPLTRPIVEWSFEDDGTYTIGLVVFDDRGEIVTTTTNVTVRNRAPNATAVFATDTPVAGEPTEFAVGANDSDGSIAEYSWRFNESDGFVLGSSTATNVYETAGVRRVTVRVTDDDGATATANATVNVNAPPAPAFDLPDTVRTGERADLLGGDSRDPDGAIETAEWDLNGDGQYERSGTNATRTYDDDGEYAITLRVVDDNGTVRTTTQNLTVRNRPPNLTTTISPSPAIVNETVRLNATAAADPDGRIVNLTWDVDADGTIERVGAHNRIDLSEAGEREVRIRAQDDDGATTTVVRTIDVKAPPKPQFPLPDRVQTNETIPLNATGSEAPRGEIVGYGWDINDTGVIDDRSARSTVRFTDEGQYKIRLVVSDDGGVARSVVRTVTVLNRRPEVSIDTSEPVIGNQVQFRAVTNDSDGRVVDIAWELDTDATVGSGGEGAEYVDEFGPNASHRYHGNRTRNVSVRVTDDDGATTTVTETVTLTAPPVSRPSVPANTTTFEAVTLDGSYSQARDGQITGYRWNVSGQTYTNETAVYVFTDDGNRRVELTVVDDSGLTDTSVVTVGVANRAPNVSIAGSSQVPVGDSITFSATTTDRDGVVEAYDWSVGGRNASTSETFQQTFESTGTRNVTLRVTDDDGATATASLTVNVTEGETRDPAPTVNYLPDSTAELDLPGAESIIAVGGSNAFYSTPTDDIYTLSDGRTISAVSVDRGEIEWNYTLAQSTTEREVFDRLNSDGIAAGYRLNKTTYRLVALDNEGTVVWRTELTTAAGAVQPLALERGTLVVGFKDDGTAKVVGLDAERGTVAWNKTLPTAVDLSRSVEEISYEEYPFDDGTTRQVVVRLQTSDGRTHVYRIQSATGRISDPISVSGRGYDVEIGDDNEVPVVINSINDDGSIQISEIDVTAWERTWNATLPTSVGEDRSIDIRDPFVAEEDRAGQSRYLYLRTRAPRGSERLHAIDRRTGNRRLTVNSSGRGIFKTEAIDEDGVAYVFQRGLNSGGVTAYDPEEGAEVYNTSEGANRFDPQTNHLIVNRGPYIVAVDGGTVAWRFRAFPPRGGPFGGGPTYRPWVTFANDRVYVSYNTTVTALDAETGEQVWETSVAGIEQTPIRTLYAAEGGDHLVAIGETQLFGLAPTGDIVWNRTDPPTSEGFLPIYKPNPDATRSSVTIQTVHDSGIGPEGRARSVTLRSYDAETGQEQWAAPIGNVSSVLKTLNQSREYAVFSIRRPTGDRYSDTETILAVDRDTGRVVTANATEDLRKVLAIGSDRRYVWAGADLSGVNRTTGEVVWQLPLDGRTQANGIHNRQGRSYVVVVVDDTLYIKETGDYDRWYWWARYD